MIYRYVGMHWGCKLALTVTLLWANPGAGHTAAWLGAQTPSASRWVQAGIAVEGPQTFRYIEWKRPKGYGISILPWVQGVPLHVRIESSGARWRASDGAEWTPWVYMRRFDHSSGLELLGDAHGIAVIAGRYIAG